MAPPVRSRTLKKNDFPVFFKPLKPVLFSEAISSRPPLITPRIASVSWSPTGALIATCTSSTIRVWSPDRPNIKSTTELKNAHAKGGVAYGSAGVSGDAVEKVTFCPTSEGVLASTGLDGMVRLWDVRVPGGTATTGGKGTPLGDCRVGGNATFLTWHPNGYAMLSGRKDDVVHSIDVRRMTGFDGTVQYELEATERMTKGKDVYNVMAFSNSGHEVFATTQEGPVRILDYPSMTALHTLGGHTANTYTVQHSPTGSYVAVGSADSTISLWDTYTWLCSHTLTSPTHNTSVRDLSFSFDGVYMVAGAGQDFKEGSAGLDIYHVDTGEVVHTVETTNCPTYVSWHPTRYWVAYAGDPGGLKILGAGSVI